jgi:hypothetical protein
VPIVYPGGIDSFNEPSLPETTPLSESGTGTRNHVEHHADLGNAVVALEQNASFKDHDHSGDGTTEHGVKLAQANTHQSSSAPASLSSALTFGDTDKSRFSLHHTLAVRNAADLGTADNDVPANGWKAAAFNHTHDFNGPSILNQPMRICTSTTRPVNPAYGTIIYETDSNVVRVWAKISSTGLMPSTSDGTPYWQILPIANVPMFKAESRMDQELIPVYPNALEFTHILSDFIWSATGIQRFMAVSSNETLPISSWSYTVRASNSGSYTLTYNGATTASLPWDATAASVHAALVTALSADPSSITVNVDTTGPFFTVYTKAFTVFFDAPIPKSTLTGNNINLAGAINTALLGPYAVSPNTQYYGQYAWRSARATPGTNQSDRGPNGGIAITIPEPGVYDVRSTIHWHPNRTYHDQSMIAILVNNKDIGRKNWEFTRGPYIPVWLGPTATALPGFAQTTKLAFSWRFQAGDTLRVVVRHNGYRNSFLWYNSGSVDANSKQTCDVEVEFRAP